MQNKILLKSLQFSNQKLQKV